MDEMSRLEEFLSKNPRGVKLGLTLASMATPVLNKKFNWDLKVEDLVFIAGAVATFMGTSAYKEKASLAMQAEASKAAAAVDTPSKAFDVITAPVKGLLLALALCVGTVSVPSYAQPIERVVEKVSPAGDILYTDGAALLMKDTQMRSAQLIEGLRAANTKLLALMPDVPMWVNIVIGAVSIAVGVAIGVTATYLLTHPLPSS